MFALASKKNCLAARIAFGIVVVVCLAAPLQAQKLERQNVAVHDFEDKTGKSSEFLGVVNESITEYLYRTKRFDLIERENLQQILKEKELVLSGITTASEARQAAEILDADYIIVGSIVEASTRRGDVLLNTEEVKVPKKRNKEGKVVEWRIQKKRTVSVTYTYVVQLSARLVSAETGEISQSKKSIEVVEETISRSFDDLGMGPFEGIVWHLAADKIAKKLEPSKSKVAGIKRDLFRKTSQEIIVEIVRDMTLKGQVIAVEGQRIVVNLGSNNGLFRRCNLRVYRNEVLGSSVVSEENQILRERTIATLIVKKIEGDYSEAELFSGENPGIRRGDRVKVVPRQLKPISALPSLVVPGSAQLMNRKFAAGFGFLLSEALFFGGLAIPMITGFYDPILTSSSRLDDVIEQDGTIYTVGGQTTSSVGRVAESEDFWIHFVGWTFVSIGAITHIYNIVDAAFPAWKNPVLVFSNGATLGPTVGFSMQKARDGALFERQLSAGLRLNF